MGASVLYHYWTSVPNPTSVTKFGGVSTTLAALLLLGIAPTIPRRRALPAPPIHPRLWQRTSGDTSAATGHRPRRRRTSRKAPGGCRAISPSRLGVPIMLEGQRDRDVCHHDPPRGRRDPGAPGVGPSSNGDDPSAGAKDSGTVPSVRVTVSSWTTADGRWRSSDEHVEVGAGESSGPGGDPARRGCPRAARPRGRGAAAARRDGSGTEGGPCRAARPAGGPDRALSRSAAHPEPDGLDLPARDRAGRALDQGTSEAARGGARQGARGADLGRERRVAHALPRRARSDVEEPRLDLGAGGRLPRSAGGRARCHPAHAEEGQPGRQARGDEAAAGGGREGDQQDGRGLSADRR